LRRDRTFFAGTIEAERERGTEFSEAPGGGAKSRINAALATPMFSRSAVSSISEGYFPTDSSSIETSWKLTHRLNQANEIMGRYAFSRTSIGREVLGSDNLSEQSARGSSHNQDQSVVAGWQYVPGPRFVNDLRFQFARRTVELTPNSRGALLDIPGVVSLGESVVLDASRKEDHLQMVESAMVLRGSHQFGFGGSVQRVSLDSQLANRFAGVFLFPTLDDFTAGRPDVFLQAFGDPRTKYSTVPLAVWARINGVRPPVSPSWAGCDTRPRNCQGRSGRPRRISRRGSVLRGSQAGAVNGYCAPGQAFSMTVIHSRF
jgi:hypothetical protein